MNPSDRLSVEAEKYASVASRSVRGTGDDEIEKSVKSALLVAFITGHTAGMRDAFDKLAAECDDMVEAITDMTNCPECIERLRKSMAKLELLQAQFKRAKGES